MRSSRIASASVPRGDTFTRAFGAADAAKKMRWRLMKSRQLASIEGSCFAMARRFYREFDERVPAPFQERQRLGGEGAELVDQRGFADLDPATLGAGK